MTPRQAIERTILSDRYALTEIIAAGGMGEVWAATDTVLRRTVAVKLLNPALSRESGFLERFRAEARHTAALHHPNITTVFDYGEDGGAAYLVMELVVGQPLSQLISTRAPLSAHETASILIQAATALEAAHHGGVLHRDVKPANILITPDGTAKLTDFGISRLVDAAPLTQTGQILGTAQYLSPEQALGRRATVSSDIYALGVVGHEMLTGQRPFDTGTIVATALAHINQPPPPLPDTVPVGIRDVISAALAKDPADRPAYRG
ncbi:MAG: serine/threonine protein kinase, partial [Actinobacteria bacterium]|nr:serine/threonine protein kinase [Actinomycetota bacterium]